MNYFDIGALLCMSALDNMGRESYQRSVEDKLSSAERKLSSTIEEKKIEEKYSNKSYGEMVAMDWREIPIELSSFIIKQKPYWEKNDLQYLHIELKKLLQGIEGKILGYCENEKVYIRVFLKDENHSTPYIKALTLNNTTLDIDAMVFQHWLSYEFSCFPQRDVFNEKVYIIIPKRFFLDITKKLSFIDRMKK
jgi:hypothetical protein